jgi:CHAT domain-containing protein/tetratricopeptide (TPR) repeat protein
MSKRHLPWICVVSCSLFSPAVFFSAAALACGAEETLLGTHHYTVDKPLLLRIDQNGTDLLIAVDNSAGTTLFNHPNDRSSFELVYLDPANGQAQDLCVHSVFRNPDILTPYTLTEIDPATLNLPLLQRFVEAARLWSQVDPQSRAQAIDEYTALGALAAAEFPLAPVAGLYAIRARMFNGEDEAALRAIDVFAPPPEFAPSSYVLDWYRGQTLLRLRRLPEAIEALALALELAPQGLDSAEIRNLLGEAYVTAGRIDDGEHELDAAVAASGSDHSLLAHIHNNRGYVLLRRAFAPNVEPGDAERWLRASIDEHLIARAFAVNGGDTSEQVLIDNNLGTLYERVRELRKALYHYREALRLTEAAGNPYNLRVLYTNLGALNQRLGDYPKSRGYLEQAVQLAEQVEEPGFRASCLLGTTYRLLGDIPRALAIHETCRDLAAGSANYPVLIDALAELSEDYLVAARTEPTAADAAWSTISAARALIDQHFPDILAAGRVARSDPRTSNICTATRAVDPSAAIGLTFQEQQLDVTARVLSRYALLAQRFAPGASALDDLDLAAGVVGPARYSGQLDIFDGALRVYAAQGNFDFARACGEAAMALSERLHEDLEAERNGPAWTAKTHETYVAVADLLLQQSTTSDDEPARAAFAVAERAMGISLRQHLSLAATDTQQSEDSQLREVLNTLADENAALSAEQRAELLPVSYYHQHDLVELSRLQRQERVTIPRALDAAQIQSQLREGQVVLYYYIGAMDAWLFTLDSRTFAAQRLGSAAELANLLATVENDLRSPNGTPAPGLRSLSAFLLPASLQLTGTRELVIVPHRDLYKIPFAALTRAQTSTALIDDFALKTTPSLTAYFMDKPASTAEHSTDIAVFADPLFNTADLRSVTDGAVERADLQTWSAGLERLPYTELEADALKALFQPENTLDFVGNRATLANLAGAPARNARILHIATHGYFHSTSSDNVGLVLSAVNENNERVPGFVTLTELFGHHFNNELVVISGCDTAMGMQLAGEGMMGLTRGFLAQGARHVISTLWPVSDRASAQFMALFYEHLHGGGSVAEALKTAQQELKALPDFRHPYYWAPYVLTTVSPADVMNFSSGLVEASARGGSTGISR